VSLCKVCASAQHLTHACYSTGTSILHRQHVAKFSVFFYKLYTPMIPHSKIRDTGNISTCLKAIKREKTTYNSLKQYTHIFMGSWTYLWSSQDHSAQTEVCFTWLQICKHCISTCLLCSINPLNPKLNPICYLLALLGAHHFLHVSRIRVKLLTLRRLMSYIYGAPILDVSRSHTTMQHSR